MKLYENINDALKYTLKDWRAIILLGIILSFGASITEIKTEDTFLIILTVIIPLILLFFEEAYRYKIIKNTIAGNNTPPRIEFNKKFLKEGMVECSIMYIYSFIIYIMGKTITMTSNSQIQIIIFVLELIIFFSFIVSGINKALHGGKYKSAFNLFEIIAFYKNIGLKNALFVIIIGTISYYLIVECVLDYGVLNLTHLIEVIISFFLSPIMLLFLTRLMALFGRKVVND